MNGAKQKPSRDFHPIIRANALYFSLFSGLALALAAALFAGPLLPWRDLPDHLALISLLDHARVMGSVANDHYTIQWLPVPYWLFYGSVWLLARIMSWTAAMQVVAFAGLLATPIALGQLLKAVGRDSRWGLIAMPLFFNHNLMYGWLSYCLGIPVLLMALAATIRLLDKKGSPKALAGWACLLFLAHAQLAALYAVLVGYLVLGPQAGTVTKRLKRLAWPLAAPVVLALPWVIARLVGQHNRGEVTDGAAVIFHDPVTRLKRLPDFLTNSWGGHSDDWMGLATIAVIILLARLPNQRSLSASKPSGRIASGLLVCTLGLYFLAPWEVRWPTNQWAIYNRFSIVAVMLSVLLIDVPFPTHPWRHRRWPALWLVLLWCVPVLLFAKRNHAVYADFNQRNAFVLEAVRDLPPNQRILPLVQDASDPASHLGAADQFHAYYVIEHGGYDPYLFDNPSHPVVHRKDTKPVVPPWNRPHRAAALRALDTWGKAPAGKERGFNIVIEQKRGGKTRRLDDAFEPPKRYGRWLVHRRKAP